MPKSNSYLLKYNYWKNKKKNPTFYKMQMKRASALNLWDRETKHDHFRIEPHYNRVEISYPHEFIFTSDIVAQNRNILSELDALMTANNVLSGDMSDSVQHASDQREAQFLSLTDSLATETGLRTAAFTSVENSLETECAALVTAITTETDNRIDAVTSVEDELNTKYEALTAAITSEEDKRIAAVTTVEDELTKNYTTLSEENATETNNRITAVFGLKEDLAKEIKERTEVLEKESGDRKAAVHALSTIVEDHVDVITTAAFDLEAKLGIEFEKQTQALERQKDALAKETVDRRDTVASLQNEVTTKHQEQIDALEKETGERHTVVANVQNDLDVHVHDITSAATTLKLDLANEVKNRTTALAVETGDRNIAVAAVQTDLDDHIDVITNAANALRVDLTREVLIQTKALEKETKDRETAISVLEHDMEIEHQKQTNALADEKRDRDIAISVLKGQVEKAVEDQTDELAKEKEDRETAISVLEHDMEIEHQKQTNALADEKRDRDIAISVLKGQVEQELKIQTEALEQETIDRNTTVFELKENVEAELATANATQTAALTQESYHRITEVATLTDDLATEVDERKDAFAQINAGLMLTNALAITNDSKHIAKSEEIAHRVDILHESLSVNSHDLTVLQDILQVIGDDLGSDQPVLGMVTLMLTRISTMEEQLHQLLRSAVDEFVFFYGGLSENTKEFTGDYNMLEGYVFTFDVMNVGWITPSSSKDVTGYNNISKLAGFFWNEQDHSWYFVSGMSNTIQGSVSAFTKVDIAGSDISGMTPFSDPMLGHLTTLSGAQPEKHSDHEFNGVIQVSDATDASFNGVYSQRRGMQWNLDGSFAISEKSTYYYLEESNCGFFFSEDSKWRFLCNVNPMSTPTDGIPDWENVVDILGNDPHAPASVNLTGIFNVTFVPHI